MWMVRHCETEWNRLGIKFGRLDPPLDNQGLNDAAVLAACFDNVIVNVVITSPLRRAVQTAEAIAARTGAPLTVDADLIEADHGAAEGLHELSRRVLFPDMTGVREADSLIRFRATRALRAAPENAVIVTHKGVLRALGISDALGFGSIHKFDRSTLEV